MLSDALFTLEDGTSFSGKSGRIAQISTFAPHYAMVEKAFNKGWKHPDKPRPPIHAIFKIMSTRENLEPYQRYRGRVAIDIPASRDRSFGNEKLLFHGTNRCCLLAEDKTRDCLCQISECHLCRIVKSSFDINKCGIKNKFRRFGTGIYTTSCSSKADDYVINSASRSAFRIMIVSRVAVGRALKRRYNATSLIAPPSGYHSVVGKPGVDLNYQETVVYDNDAIRPAFLVVYGFPPEPKESNTLRSVIKSLFRTPLAS